MLPTFESWYALCKLVCTNKYTPNARLHCADAHLSGTFPAGPLSRRRSRGQEPKLVSPTPCLAEEVTQLVAGQQTLASIVTLMLGAPPANGRRWAGRASGPPNAPQSRHNSTRRTHRRRQAHKLPSKKFAQRFWLFGDNAKQRGPRNACERPPPAGKQHVHRLPLSGL